MKNKMLSAMPITRLVKVLRMPLFTFLIGVSIGAAPCAAATLEGVQLPDVINPPVATETLILNGMGVREATIFNVNVYVAGLYLKTASKNPDEILNSAPAKQIRMKFVRSVGRKDLLKAWNKSHADNCTPIASATTCAELKAQMELLAPTLPDLKEGDEMVYAFAPNQVDLILNNTGVGTLKAPHADRALLAAWLGKNPPNQSLKHGLLGGG